MMTQEANETSGLSTEEMNSQRWLAYIRGVIKERSKKKGDPEFL